MPSAANKSVSSEQGTTVLPVSLLTSPSALASKRIFFHLYFLSSMLQDTGIPTNQSLDNY